MEILFQRSVTLFQAVATESTGAVREMVVLPVVPLELPLLPVFPVLLLSPVSFFHNFKSDRLAGEKSIFSGDGNAGRSGVHIVGQGERVIFSFCEGPAVISDANRWSDRFSGISLIRNCGDASIAFQGNKRAGSCIVSAEGDTDGRDLFRAGIFGGRERISPYRRSVSFPYREWKDCC